MKMSEVFVEMGKLLHGSTVAERSLIACRAGVSLGAVRSAIRQSPHMRVVSFLALAGALGYEYDTEPFTAVRRYLAPYAGENIRRLSLELRIPLEVIYQLRAGTKQGGSIGFIGPLCDRAGVEMEMKLPA